MSIWKKFACAFLALTMLLALAACGGTDEESPAQEGGEAPAAEESGHKVAMILPGSITDMSWNYSSYEGLKQIEASGAEISYQEQVDTARDIVAQTGADYPHLLPSQDLFGLLSQIYAVPTTFFVDSQGRQVGSAYVSAYEKEQWVEIIDGIMEEAGL